MRKPNGIIAFLTDVGHVDPYASSMEGVALAFCRDVRTVCITHGIPSFDVYEAAFTLLSTYKYFSPGTIFVVVVVPGVGSSEKPILIVTKNYFLIGPGDGILISAAENDGIEQVYTLDKYEHFREPVSETFQGRYMSAPVAAQIACGTPPPQLGTPINPSVLTRGDLGFKHELEGNYIMLKIVHIDKYGNVILSQYYKKLANELNTKAGDIVKVQKYKAERSLWKH